MGAINNDVMAGFEQFSRMLDKTIFDKDGKSTADQFTNSPEHVQDKNTAGKFYLACKNFINNNGLFSNTEFTSKFSIDSGVEYRISSELQGYPTLASKHEALIDLCKECGIEGDNQIKETVQSLATILHRFGTAESTISEHWATPNAGEASDSAAEFFGGESDMIGGGEFAFDQISVGAEAFGQDIDKVIPDVKAAMTVVLLKPHRGITDRIFHKRTVSNPIVRYVIPFDELFDLNQAADKSGKVRNSHNHIVPMLNLFRDPGKMAFNPRKVVPLEDNDPTGEFLVDGDKLRFGVDIDLFDMAAEAEEDTTRVDHTSFIAEGARFEKVYVEITKTSDGTKEKFVINTKADAQSKFLWRESSNDSGDTNLNFRFDFQCIEGVKTDTGADSAIFADVKDSQIIYLQLDIFAKQSRKTSVTYATGTAKFVPASAAKGVEISQELIDLVADLEVELIGYDVDCRYSQENVRTSNLIVRTNVYTRTYALPATSNFMFDYSIKQAQPEKVLDSISTIQQIGCDHRNIKLVRDLFEQVFLQNKAEANDPNYRANTDNRTLNMRYAAGSRVNPHVIVKTLKLSDLVKNIRSSDNTGDLRATIDGYLTKLFSELHVNSLYTNQLNHGEQPTYKVITSIPILENLLSAPHIHNHLMPQGFEKELYYKNGNNSEYTKVLNSGVVLKCLPCTFDYMRDQIIILPYRETDAESEYNLGHNYDYGTFAAHYMPIAFQGVHKRMLVNVREFPIPTNPIGMIITITDLMEVLPDVTAEGSMKVIGD